jgi:hypothetical protein
VTSDESLIVEAAKRPGESAGMKKVYFICVTAERRNLMPPTLLDPHAGCFFSHRLHGIILFILDLQNVVHARMPCWHSRALSAADGSKISTLVLTLNWSFIGVRGGGTDK